MAATQPEGQATVIAVYPDHASAEEAVRRLHKEGIPMQNLSFGGLIHVSLLVWNQGGTVHA